MMFFVILLVDIFDDLCDFGGGGVGVFVVVGEGIGGWVGGVDLYCFVQLFDVCVIEYVFFVQQVDQVLQDYQIFVVGIGFEMWCFCEWCFGNW